jgi:Kinesin motor domain
MQGRGFEGKDDRDSEERGLQPRVFDYIYSRAKQDMTDGECEHLLKASYFEIYNEQIVDLVGF